MKNLILSLLLVFTGFAFGQTPYEHYSDVIIYGTLTADQDWAKLDSLELRALTISGVPVTFVTQEQVEDWVGGMMVGIETLISVDYDDPNGEIDYVVDEASIDHASITNTHNLSTDIIHSYVDSVASALTGVLRADAGLLSIDSDVTDLVTFPTDHQIDADTTTWDATRYWVGQQGYITGNESITLSGDVSGTGTTAITTTIGADKILESMLKEVSTTPGDEDFLTYEGTGGDFEWHSIADLDLATQTWHGSNDDDVPESGDFTNLLDSEVDHDGLTNTHNLSTDIVHSVIDSVAIALTGVLRSDAGLLSIDGDVSDLVDHASIANTHNLSTDIIHSVIDSVAIALTGVLRSDAGLLSVDGDVSDLVDHESIANTHNLSTDIVHNVIDSVAVALTGVLRTDAGLLSIDANVTDLVDVFAGTGADGLVPDPTSETGLYLKDDGTWSTPVGGGGDPIHILDGGVSISTDPDALDFLGADFVVTDATLADSVEISLASNIMREGENITLLDAPNTWRLFYSNGTNDITELALGASGYLKTNGVDQIPTWASPGGAGTMTYIDSSEVQIGGSDIAGLDFNADDFNLTEAPDTEINISIDDSGIDHDATTNFVAEEHIRWDLTGAGTIHIDNYIENVSTSLTLDTPTATTIPINSDGSSPDITLIEATTTTAGILGSGKWNEIVANSLKATNVSTSLTLDTPTSTTVPINSDGSSPDITLIEATTSTAGLLGATKWDEIVANSAFTTTPSTVITAGTNIDWSGNTLNVTGGSGDVTAVPTPLDNQIAVWTGATSIEGDANFTWTATGLYMAATIMVMQDAGDITWSIDSDGDANFELDNGGGVGDLSRIRFEELDVDKMGILYDGELNLFRIYDYANATGVIAYDTDDSILGIEATGGMNVNSATIGSWQVAIRDDDGAIPLRLETGVAGGAVYESFYSNVQEWRIGFDVQEDFVIVDQTSSLTGLEILNATGNIVLFGGLADTDHTLTFNGESSDLVWTYMEDEQYLTSNRDLWIESNNAVFKVDGGTGDGTVEIDAGGADTARVEFLAAGAIMGGLDYASASNTFRFYEIGQVVWTYDQEDEIFVTNVDFQLEDSEIILDATPDSDHTGSGTKATFTNGNGGSVNFGDVCFIQTDGDLEFADADGVSTMPGFVMALATITATSAGEWLVQGFARDASWSWTIGGEIFISLTATTGNTLTQTAPSASGDIVQIVGIATSATEMYFYGDFSTATN